MGNCLWTCKDCGLKILSTKKKNEERLLEEVADSKSGKKYAQGKPGTLFIPDGKEAHKDTKVMSEDLKRLPLAKQETV